MEWGLMISVWSSCCRGDVFCILGVTGAGWRGIFVLFVFIFSL